MTRPALLLSEVCLASDRSAPLLEAVDLTVAAGGLTGVLTTEESARALSRVALGMTRPDSGMVMLLGLELGLLGADAARRLRVRCGVMLSPGLLVSNLTALDNVALPVCWSGRSQADARELAMDTLARWELAPLASRRPAQLTPGEQRMVALARVVADAPELAVLEQPQLDGDLRVTTKLVEMVRALLEQGAGVLVISGNQRLSNLLPGSWGHLTDGVLTGASG